jgi:carbon-monoxide dehydrogenase medium subunit
VRQPRGGSSGDAVLAAFGVSDRPVVRDVTPLLDLGPDEDQLSGAMGELADAIVDTGGDVHASAGYRRQLLAALAARELARAMRQSGDSDDD